MEGGLLDLLRTCNSSETKDNGEYTHITTYGPSSKWSILDNKYETFWKKYCELAESPEDSKRKLCLAEIPRKHMPIIVDLTLKFHPLENDSKDGDYYGEDFILALVYCYQQVIKETLKISEGKHELICCVLKTESTMEDNLIVCRIRLQFPYCKTLAQVQNRLIRPLVLQMVRNINVISRLESQPVNDWEDIIDPLSVEKPIMMYGSSAGPSLPKLVLEYTFPDVKKEDIDECKTNVMELSETFYFVSHEHVATGIVTTGMFEDEEVNDFWIPFFLSIYYLKDITLVKNSSPSKLSIVEVNNFRTSNSKANLKSSWNEEEPNSPENLCSVFLSLLDKKRSEELHYWQDVGQALHSCFNGEERGLEKWSDFSENSDVFTPEDCKSKYYNFTENKITLKTLAFYAKEDSPIEYKKWHESWYFPALEKATSCAHVDVAEAIYKIYWLEFACSNLTKTVLYHFKNQIWTRMDSGHTLKSIISKEFIEILEKFRTDVSIQVQESSDKNYKDTAEIMIQKICKLIGKLKTRAFKSAVFSEAAEMFFVPEFEHKLDSNPNLMGCINGIVETLDTKSVFRDGKPEDYVNKSTRISWRHDMSEKHPLYMKLISWLSKVFPDKELLNHFGKLMGATLRGRNADKIFPIHTGKGNNSKSMIKKLVEAAFGDYVVTFPTSTFTSAKSSGGADPAVARSKFAHIAFIQEPDAETPLKSGTIKEFTGGDRFFTRFLHDNGGEIEPMFILNLMCNAVPIIPQCDKAIKNRVRILPYLSTWTTNPPKTPEEQFRQRTFLMDPFFEKQIPEMASAFLFYCTKMYSVYRREGLRDPDIVIKYTDAYWEENDIYGQFVKENLEKAYKLVPEGYKGERPMDESSFIDLADMYSRFKDWHKENFGNLKTPDRQIFRTEIETRVAKSVNRKFYGIKFKIPTVMEI